ncbi:MAG TPA: hypothetical protein VJN32_00220, partial [Dehalococcoidia bacterium]|nr:hypothetical protein [Dehalococcoidia bacterium]
VLPPAGDAAAGRGVALPIAGPHRRPGAGGMSRRRPSPWWAVAGVAAAAAIMAVGSSHTGPPPPDINPVRAYACRFPTDATLAWAEVQGVHVDVRACPPREEK